MRKHYPLCHCTSNWYQDVHMFKADIYKGVKMLPNEPTCPKCGVNSMWWTPPSDETMRDLQEMNQ